MLQAAGEQLPALTAALLELDILGTAGSVLGSFLRQLEREQQEFAGEEAEGEGGGGGSSGSAGLEAEGPAGEAAEGPQEEGSGAAAAAAADGPGAVTVSSKAPEVSEAIAVEALSLVDGLTADAGGTAAVSAAAGLVRVVARLLALCESDPVRLVCLTLLAPLEGMGAVLASEPGALRGALAALAGVQAGGAGTPAEVGAAWALLAVGLHAAAEAMPEERSGGGDAASAAAIAAAALLAAAADYRGVLLGEWRQLAGGEEEADAARAQQRFCVRQLQLLLGRQGTAAAAEGAVKELGEALAAWLAEGGEAPAA